jgi:hypothetical protein
MCIPLDCQEVSPRQLAYAIRTAVRATSRRRNERGLKYIEFIFYLTGQSRTITRDLNHYFGVSLMVASGFVKRIPFLMGS